MKQTLFITILLLIAGSFTINGQSRANRLFRNCAGTATKATVEVNVSGNILLTPCSGGTVSSGGTVKVNAINLISNSPSTPTVGVNLGTTLAETLSWVKTSGFVTTFGVTTQTAARNFTLPDISGRVLTDTAVTLDRTITASGTTGNRTINQTAGTVNFAAAASAITVTNSSVGVDSLVFVTIRKADTTCTFVKSVVVPAPGSFTITLNAGCGTETSVGFLVTN